MSAALGALKIVGLGALVGFGTTAIARAATAPRRRALGAASAPRTCVDQVWGPLIPLSPSSVQTLSLPAVLTLQQFPGFHLAGEIQPEALALVREYVDAVEESEEEGNLMLDFPGVEDSSIPEDGQTVGVDRQLDRVENYMRFAAAAAAATLAPDCAWPEPFSTQAPEDPHAAAVWRSLEYLAVVALAERDERQIRVDVDPEITVLDDLLEACMPEDVVLPLRSPTTLAPDLGGDDDASWQISHTAQINAFSVLQDQLSDPDATAPSSAAVAALAPRCPWGDKVRYGLAMTTLWYDVRRLERIVDRQEAA